MDISNTKLIQLQNNDIQNILDAINKNNIDILILYLTFDSDTYDYIQQQRVSIVGFRTLDFDRVKLYYPYISPEKVSLRNIFTYIPSNKLLIPDWDDNTILPKMTMKLLNISNINNQSTTNTSNVETFISRISIDPESISAYYRCYGNPYIESKAECESPNDLYGNPIEQIKWDKTCSVNEDCPFYKKNTNYSNERGGCLDNGLCEMPIGVLQAAPRKYFDSGRFKPFCYGCSNNIDCCDQTNDYAFKNDIDDRIAAGLKTSIPFM